MPGSPASRADIQEDDIILEIDGQRLTQDLSLAQIVHSKSPGDKLTLTIDRDGRKLNSVVTLGELKNDD